VLTGLSSPTAPPLTAMAAAAKPVVSWATSFRSTKLQPVTRMVGNAVDMVKLALLTMTLPPSTMIAGERPTNVVKPPVPLMIRVNAQEHHLAFLHFGLTSEVGWMEGARLRAMYPPSSKPLNSPTPIKHQNSCGV
jgi:hypothetical protein